MPEPASGTALVSGALEGSNVSPVETIVSMVAMLRSYEASQRAIQAVDEAERKAANDIGRLP